MSDYGYTWAQVAHEKAIMNQFGLDPEIVKYKSDLLEFLKLIEQLDFSHRYGRGDPKTKGIEARHEILKHHIAKMQIDAAMKESK